MNHRTIASYKIRCFVYAIMVGTCAGASAQESGTPIPQPKVADLKVSDANKRVDLVLPKFSNPTKVTNPLFPVSKQASVLFTGKVDEKPFRTEVTLLAMTRIVKWQGIQVETLVSQYVAYLDGRVQEVAYDLYAQADDGSVWYFGEDVSDFRDGLIYSKEGTWLAGKDGPPCMIMPGHPKVGDVFRAENMPGIAFEEVTVTQIDHSYDGPFGPIAGALLGRELRWDGDHDEKTFAPGYGEVFTGSGGDVEAIALAIPTDSLAKPIPSALSELCHGALMIFEDAGSNDWKSASERIKALNLAWEELSTGDLPKPIKSILNDALKSLSLAVKNRTATQARQSAIETARWGFDLQLRYRPVHMIDLARFDLWSAQVLIDAAAQDKGAVNGDMFTLTLIRDRILGVLDFETNQNLNIQLGELMTAVADEELAKAVDAANKLRGIIANAKPVK